MSRTRNLIKHYHKLSVVDCLSLDGEVEFPGFLNSRMTTGNADDWLEAGFESIKVCR